MVEVHVDVPLGADHAFVQLDDALRADQHAAGRAGDLAAGADRQRRCPAKCASVNASSTWLCGRVGPSTRTWAASAAAGRRPSPFPRPRKSRPDRAASSSVSLWPGPNSVSTCSSVRCRCRAEMLTTSFGAPLRAAAGGRSERAEHDFADDLFDGRAIERGGACESWCDFVSGRFVGLAASAAGNVQRARRPPRALSRQASRDLVVDHQVLNLVRAHTDGPGFGGRTSCCRPRRSLRRRRRIMARSVSTSSRLLLKKPRSLMPATLRIVRRTFSRASISLA